jgi:glycosyltransferase involved in cell wall biosynthesis
MIIVNAIGCKESGTRIIAKYLCESYSGDEQLLFLVANTRSDFPKNDKVYLIALSHSIFGRLLRPLYELCLFLVSLLPGIQYSVNLSSYGLCFGKRQSVYFQNANLLRENDSLFKTGRSNAINRFLLKSCLRNARKVVVQTSVVEEELRSFYGSNIRAPLQICMPYIHVESREYNHRNPNRFCGFYPTSPYPYKRNDLAMGAFASLTDDHRLRITIADGETSDRGIEKVGMLDREAMAENYAACDYLLFTSAIESLGMPLLEALSIGLPAVLPSLAYSREIYGDAAVYFEGSSAESVAAAIRELKIVYSEKKQAAVARRNELRTIQKTWQEHWDVLLND